MLWGTVENNIKFIHQFNNFENLYANKLGNGVSGEAGIVFSLSKGNPGDEDALPIKALAGAMELIKLCIIDNSWVILGHWQLEKHMMNVVPSG